MVKNTQFRKNDQIENNSQIKLGTAHKRKSLITERQSLPYPPIKTYHHSKINNYQERIYFELRKGKATFFQLNKTLIKQS